MSMERTESTATKDDPIKFEGFEISEEFCVDLNGSTVKCRRHCIDVTKVYRQDQDGDTLLHIAIISLDSDLAAYIIDWTPCPEWLNTKNKLAQTPLHVAVLTNQITVVRRLIVAGADICQVDRHGNTALHLACREKFIDCLLAMLKPIGYEEQKRNNYNIPTEIVDQKQNLDSVNYVGFACLHLAASNNQIDIVRLLLENGADVHVKTEKSGRTILHEAAWQGNIDLVRFLISLGNTCLLNAKSYDGFTAFDLARSREHWAIVSELAKEGAKLEEEKDVE